MINFGAKVIIFFEYPNIFAEKLSKNDKNIYFYGKWWDSFPNWFKFWMYRIAWKAILWVTPYIRVKRGCAGDKVHNPSTAWRAVHREKSCVKANQVQPSRLVGVVVVLYPRASSPSSSMHLGSSLWSGAMRSPHSIAFQAILYIQNLNQLGKECPSFIEKTYIFIVFR